MNTSICIHINIHMSMNTITLMEKRLTLMIILMNMVTITLMNISTNMIIPAQRMNMTMSTLVNTDRMIMIIPVTRQKNIHTIINS